MKKTFIILLVVIMLIVLASVSFAHPAVPEQSLQRVDASAANGMHTAWGNIQSSNGVASHVFLMRHSPH